MLNKSRIDEGLLSAEQALQMMRSSLEIFAINGERNSGDLDIDLVVNDIDVLLHQLEINPVTQERNEFIWQLWSTSIRQVIGTYQVGDLIPSSYVREIAKYFLKIYCKSMKL